MSNSASVAITTKIFCHPFDQLLNISKYCLFKSRKSCKVHLYLPFTKLITFLAKLPPERLANVIIILPNEIWLLMLLNMSLNSLIMMCIIELFLNLFTEFSDNKNAFQ